MGSILKSEVMTKMLKIGILIIQCIIGYLILKTIIVCISSAIFSYRFEQYALKNMSKWKKRIYHKLN